MIRTQFGQPQKTCSSYRNGVNVLPTVLVAGNTATRATRTSNSACTRRRGRCQDYRVRRAALSYAAFRVGDEHATYDEVSTAPPVSFIGRDTIVKSRRAGRRRSRVR